MFLKIGFITPNFLSVTVIISFYNYNIQNGEPYLAQNFVETNGIQ
jgi:hypothetical protein